MILEPGTVLGRFHVGELTHRGDLGVVYRAEDLDDGAAVALRVLPEEVAEDPDRLGRLMALVRRQRGPSHSGLAALRAYEAESGTHFMVMEWVGGQTLDQRLARGPLPLVTAVDCFLQVAAALEQAHEQGLLHLGLRLTKIALDERADDGPVAKVLDLGLEAASREMPDAIAIAHGASPPERAEPSSDSFVSPEALRGEPLDRRADIWAFGVCLACALGIARLRATDEGRLRSELLDAGPDWRSLAEEPPEALVRVVRRCLVGDPYLRLRDLGDARLELADAQAELRARPAS